MSALLMAKRMLVDGWSEARALDEATLVGPPSATPREFVLKYVAERRK